MVYPFQVHLTTRFVSLHLLLPKPCLFTCQIQSPSFFFFNHQLTGVAIQLEVESVAPSTAATSPLPFSPSSTHAKLLPATTRGEHSSSFSDIHNCTLTHSVTPPLRRKPLP
ncbi:hypothetical protein PIB30_021051 [Stylosanthes scabra]|uniref:Uncharacterized protein n=1 Tax=Stylosanthes scabra TaxID=79078 RepID=A0ABU6W713_9FABA|nr:hypothetical protein [Stylosanthes scabra]